MAINTVFTDYSCHHSRHSHLSYPRYLYCPCCPLPSAYKKKKPRTFVQSFRVKVAMTYSPTNLVTGSTIPAADSHAKCGIVTPRGTRLAGIVKFYRSRFVGAGGDRSHVARTKCVPGGSQNRRHHKERRALTLIYKKRESQFLETLFRKSGDDLLSHKSLQYHRRCWA